MKKNIALLFLAFVQSTLAYVAYYPEPDITPYHWEDPAILSEMESKQDGISNECREAIKTLKSVFKIMRSRNEDREYIRYEALEILENFISQYENTCDSNIQLLIVLARCKIIPIGYQDDEGYFPEAIKYLKQVVEKYRKNPDRVVAELLLEAKIDLGIQINRIKDSYDSKTEEDKEYHQLHKELINMIKKGDHDLQTTILLARYLLWGCSEPSRQVTELRQRFLDEYGQTNNPTLQEYVAYGFYLLYTEREEKSSFTEETCRNIFFPDRNDIYNQLIELFHASSNEHIQLVVASAMFRQADKYQQEKEEIEARDILKQIQTLFDHSTSGNVQFYVLLSMMSQAQTLPPLEGIKIYDMLIEKYQTSKNCYIMQVMNIVFASKMSLYEKTNQPIGKILSACDDMTEYHGAKYYSNKEYAIEIKYKLYSNYSPILGKLYLKHYIRNSDDQLGLSRDVKRAKELLKK